MQIISFKIQNYRQFDELEISLEKGLNIIFGNNEAGKSTITQALLDVLFLEPDRKNKRIQQMASWKSEQLPVMELQFEHKGVNCRLIKDFQHKRAELEIQNGQEGRRTITGIPEVTAMLQRILAFKSQEIYKNTAFLTADSIALIHNDDIGFKNALQNAAVSGGASVQVNTIINVLKKQKEEMQRGTKAYSKNPGQLKAAAEQVESINAKLKDAKTGLESARQYRQQLQETNAELQKVNQVLDENEALVDDNEKIQRLLKDKETLNREYNELAKDKELLTKLENDNAVLDSKYSDLPDYDWDALGRDLEEYGTNTAAVKLLQQEKALGVSPAKISGGGKTKQTLLIIGALFVVAALIAFALQSPTIAIIAIVIALVCGIAAFFGPKPGTKSTISAADQAEDNLEKQTNVLIAGYGVASIVELENLLKKKLKLDAEAEEVNNKIGIMRERRSPEELSTRERELLHKIGVIDDRLETLHADNIAVSSQEFIKKKTGIDTARQQVQKLEAARVELETLLKSSSSSEEQVAELEEQLQLAEEARQKAEERFAIINMISEGLEKAISDTANAASRQVENEVEKYLPRLTEERYGKCRLNSDLSLDVYSKEKAGWCLCEPESIELSRGTVDQVYFITRLAFIRLLTGNDSMPIIMDDPLLTFDEKRKLIALDILKEFSQTHQVIFFTFDKSLPAQLSLTQA